MVSESQVKKILVLAANPRDTSRLRLDQEVREISEGLRRARKGELFDLSQRWAVRPKDLRQALLDVEPQIVHFSGHGSQSGLFLENDLGQPQLVSPDALAGLFKLCAAHVQCVVLNACYSKLQAEAITRHINYVVGMNQAIGDRAAIEFAVGFYDALGAGRDIKDSYEFGRNAIALEGISEYLTPELVTKNPSENRILSLNWHNEAYVSLHLAQEVLEKAGIEKRSTYSHWYPQFKIKTSNPSSHGVLQKSSKPVDFLIEDRRGIKFLVEVKTANSRIDDKARFQLRMYLQHSGIKFGIIIDPFLLEIYEWSQEKLSLKGSFVIENAEQIQPVSNFLKKFLDSIPNENDCNSHI